MPTALAATCGHVATRLLSCGCPVPACGCEQAEDRAHRIGQKKEVVVVVLVSAGTIEQVILDRAQQKKEIDAKVIQVSCSVSPLCLGFLILCQVYQPWQSSLIAV